jgi:hypothetical protein
MIFEKPGEGNTEQTLVLAYERAVQLGIQEIVVSSSTGKSGYRALEIFNGLQIVVVTYHCGFRKPFKKVMPDAVRADLEQKGAKVVSATHALSGVERSIHKKYSGIYPVLLIADTLRLFGQGTKVAVEISIMAADAGMLSGNDIISIGGTAKGLDAALVLKPAHQSTLFSDMCIREVICKPRTL